MLLYRSLNFCDGFFRFRHVSLSVTQRRHAGCNSRAFSILPRSNSIVQRMCVHFPWAYLQHPYRRQPRTWQMMVRRPIPRIYIYRWLLVLHLAWLNEFHSYGQPVCAHRKKNRMRRNKIRRINEYYRSQTTNKPYVNQQHQRIQKFHSFWKFLHSTSSNKLKIRGDTKRRNSTNDCLSTNSDTWRCATFHTTVAANTYIDVQTGKWKYFNGRYFLGCVSKEFPSAFIPFDGIQCFVFCIVVANKLRHFAALHCTRNGNVQYSQSQW